jgi:hypothetical protein
MSGQRVVLSNVGDQLAARGAHVVIDPQSSGLTLRGADNWRIEHRTLLGGVSSNVEVVDLCNGRLSVSVLPTRGMGVWRAQLDETPIGWSSPVRHPVHPRHVELTARNGLGWLDGFNELICRCGLAFNGPPGHDEGARSPVESQLTLHGRIANTPAHSVDVSVDEGEGTLSVTGAVDEATMFGPQLRMTSTISTRAGSDSFAVVDVIENTGAGETELQLLYHTNIGPPFLEAGASVLCPARTVVPRDARAADGIDMFATYAGPTPGYAEQVYYFDPIADAENESLVLLRNAAGDLGVSVHFDGERLPCLSVWKCTQAEADGYVTGLEPATNYPNFKAFEREQQRVVRLAPGETFRSWLRLEVHSNATAVADIQERISALQIRSGPEVRRDPVMPFCPTR